MRRLLTHAAALVLSVSAGLVVATAPPASAAACDTASGVTVVVDFNQLDGNKLEGTCVARGGGKAADLFRAAGFTLDYAQRQPGFVCRVSGVPADDPCVNASPTNRYWSLWWSTGEYGARWTYSSLGVGGLEVPDGGLVAFSWNQSSGRVAPSASPTRPGVTEPEPDPEPTDPDPQPDGPGPGGSPGGSGGGSPATPEGANGSGTTPDPTDGATEPSETKAPEPRESAAGPSGKKGDEKNGRKGGERSDEKRGESRAKTGGDASAEPVPAPSGTPSTGVPELAEPAPPRASTEAAGGGLPGWVAPGLVLVLLAGAGGVVLARRRQSGP